MHLTTSDISHSFISIMIIFNDIAISMVIQTVYLISIQSHSFIIGNFIIYVTIFIIYFILALILFIFLIIVISWFIINYLILLVLNFNKLI